MTTKTLILTTLLFFLQVVFVNAQDALIFQHRKKVHRTKKVRLDREYGFQVNDTTFLHGKIVGFTDSMLRIPVRKSVDSVFTTTRTEREWVKDPSTGKLWSYDTTMTKTLASTRYHPDTLVVSFSDIQVMRKGWFKSDRWLEPFGWIIAGCVVGVVALPVAAVTDGKRGVRDWATVEAVALGVSLTVVFIGHRATKYDLTKKWRLTTR